MTATTAGESPQVSHPQTPSTDTPQPGTASAPAARANRSIRRRMKLPPPQVILAGALAVAALELLIWQVGGVWWGVLIHAILAGILLLLLVVWLVVNWRLGRAIKALSGRSGGVRPAGGPRSAGGGRSLRSLFGGRANGSTGGSGGGRSGRLGRLLGGGRGRSGAGGSPTGTGGRAGRGGGLLGRLRPAATRGGAAGTGRSVRGGSATGGRPGAGTQGARGRLGRLLGGGRGGSGSPGPGAGRSVRRGGTRSGGDTKRTRSGRAGSAGFWDATKAAFRSGQDRYDARRAAKNQRQDQTPPTPVDQPAAKPVHKPDGLLLVDEQRVREQVQKAARVKPVAATAGGGAQMGNMQQISDAADQLAEALRNYDEEDMHQLVRDFPTLSGALERIAGGLRHLGSRTETEMPLAQPITDAVVSMARDVSAAASTADSARGILRTNHETDIERGEAPRGGSAAIEGKWNVGR